jgi:WD40 repeat protein
MTAGVNDTAGYGATPRVAVQVFPVAIGRYHDPAWPDLRTGTEAGRVVDLLAAYGGQADLWAAPELERGADAVQRRLREWADSAGLPGFPLSTVLYWAGHGWSDGSTAVLAHRDTPNPAGAYGVSPLEFSYAIRDRQAALHARVGDLPDGQGWALVVIDTCRSKRFAELVTAWLKKHDLPFGVMLVGVSGDGATTLGRFTAALRCALAATYPADQRIPLADLGTQLRRMLPGCEIDSFGDLAGAELVPILPPVASLMSAPLTEIRYLEEVLDDLDPDERRHFLAKAQGSEHGELSWFFEGREDELALIGSWLQQASSGMLIVTGRAGSGKSALLGNVLVRSLPALRDALARRGLVSIPVPGTPMPPESVFDAVIHLSGLDLGQAAGRVAAAAGIGPLPSLRDPDLGIAGDLDFLASRLAERAEPLTILADALDESIDPLDSARSLLARIAVIPGVRVLVGTRASTNETPDAPADDENLLDALTAGAAGPGVSDRDYLIQIGRDAQAICRYVTGRLLAARAYGVAGRAVPFMSDVVDDDIRYAAAEVAAQEQGFLFARLAVYELIADPRLLAPGMRHSRSELLQGSHQDLFARALHRLADHDDRFPVLMRALSVARGRGIPEADGIWAAIAAALSPMQAPRPDGDLSSNPNPGMTPAVSAAWAQAISDLLGHAAAYITVDTDTGYGKPTGSKTVYRLAHRTFVEFFAAGSAGSGAWDDPRLCAAGALLRVAVQAAAAGPGRLPAYLARHLCGHAAEADMWDDLADHARVLDGLDPAAVTTDAIRTLFGRRAVPPPIAGIIGARDTLASAAPADRPGLRQLATTVHSSRQVIYEPVTTWGVAAAQAGRSTVHVRLDGHTGPVTSVCALTLHDGRTVLASASDDGTIRLWDPASATPIGAPMAGHSGAVESICVLRTDSGRVLLVTAGHDATVRLWDPATGQSRGQPMRGHDGPVSSVCAVPGREPGQSDLIATGGYDRTVRLWDPATGLAVGEPMTGHAGAVLCVCAVPGRQAGQRVFLATAANDGTVRLWDPATGLAVGEPMTGHAYTVWHVCAVPGREPDEPAFLASTGYDATVRLWDPATGLAVGEPMTGHAGGVSSVCALPGREAARSSLLASTGNDGMVRLWNPVTRQPSGQPLTGHAGAVLSVCAVPGREPGQPVLLATGGHDKTVRLWDPSAGQPMTSHVSAMARVCAVPGREPGQATVLAAAGRSGAVWLWDPATGQPSGQPLTGHTGSVSGLCAVPGQGPSQATLLATTGYDATMRLWDPASGQPAGEPMTGHSGPVTSVCTVPGHSTLLATTGYDGTVRLWDPLTGQPSGQPLTGHSGPVSCVCLVSGQEPGEPILLATTGADGTVRLWDPATGQATGEPMTGHVGAVLRACAIPGRRAGPPTLVATAGNDGTVRLWDPATGLAVGEPMTGHAGPVVSVCAVAGREPGQPAMLASTGDDGTVRLWDPATGLAIGEPMTGHAGTAEDVCAISDAESAHPVLLATAGDDGTVRLWDPATRRPVGEPLVRSPEAIRGMSACSRSYADHVTANGDGTVRAWTSATASFHDSASPPRVYALAVLNSPDHASLLTGDITGRIHLSDLVTGHEACPPLQVDSRAVLVLCPLQDGTARVAAAGGTGLISIVAISSAGHLDRGPVLRSHNCPIRALSLIKYPDGRQLLAAAGNDGTIRIWDPDANAAQTGPLTGHDGWIWSLTAIPASSGSPPRLASAGADQTVRLWDPATGRSLADPLIGHTDQVRTVTTATSDDGRTVLISGGHDGTIRLWHPVTGAPGAVIPIGTPVQALIQDLPDPKSRERTADGATLTVGLRTGILTLDLHRDQFPDRSHTRK